MGKDPSESQLQVFGNDFETPDGTCIRDYVHVSDLCAAHLLAMKRLSGQGPAFEAFNLGTDKGNSVLEVIEACRKITGHDISYTMSARRAGDPARLVASSVRAKEILGWKPRYSDLLEIVSTAWRWFSKS